MIAALVSGTLYGTPTEREARNGNAYITCKIRAPSREGNSLFISVTVFQTAAIEVLRNLSDGDPLSAIGEIGATAYTDKSGEPRPSLQMVASQILTVHQVKRRRADASQKPISNAERSRSAGRDPELDDSIPF